MQKVEKMQKSFILFGRPVSKFNETQKRLQGKDVVTIIQAKTIYWNFKASLLYLVLHC